MSQIKQEPLQAMLYMLYRRGNSAEDALRGIEETFGEGVTTLDQVKVFYGTFENGGFSVMEPTEEERLMRMQTALTAANVPNLIMGYLNFESRLALRNTSRMFREITTRIPLQIKRVEIKYKENYLRLTIDREYKFLMLTRKRQKYREPRNDYKKRIQSFYKNVTAELVKFFKFKSLTVTRLCLHRECLESRDRPNTFTTLRMHRAIIDALLESLRIVHGVNNERMHVEQLCMNSVALFNDIMPILEVDWLGRIFLLECDNRRWDTFPGTHPITQTDQWKSSYWFFSSMAVKIERSLANFSHFGYCKMEIAYDLIDLDLEELKADLLRNPDLCHFRIRGDDDLTPNERDQINQRLETQTGVWTEFIYPENATLKLWIRVFRGTVWFKGPRHSEKVGLDEANEPD